MKNLLNHKSTASVWEWISAAGLVLGCPAAIWAYYLVTGEIVR